jgi:hypothetical protein
MTITVLIRPVPIGPTLRKAFARDCPQSVPLLEASAAKEELARI